MEPYLEAEKIRSKQLDQQMWIFEHYMFNALQVSLAQFGAGLSGKRSNAKIIDKPMFAQEIEPEGDAEALAVYEMKQRTKLLEKEGLAPSPR